MDREKAKERLHALVLEYSLWENYKDNLAEISELRDEDELYGEDIELSKSYDKKQEAVIAEIDLIIDGITT